MLILNIKCSLPSVPIANYMCNEYYTITNNKAIRVQYIVDRIPIGSYYYNFLLYLFGRNKNLNEYPHCK